jgi:hypothetical protein
MQIVTKKEFMDLGREVFSDYLPGTPAPDRRAFLENLYHELKATDARFEEDGDEELPRSLKDLNNDDGLLYQEWVDDGDV